MTIKRIFKICIPTFVLMLLFTYFLGCSPIIYFCFAYGMTGIGLFALLIFALSILSVFLLYKYTDIAAYFSKDKFIGFSGRLAIERKELIWLVLIILVGGGIRILGVDWGVDRIFQPDEAKLVAPAIGMAQSKYLYSASFGYPSQFVSKFAALLIMVYSYVHPISSEAGNVAAPYFIFRAVVAMISTGTIAVSYLIGNKLHKRLGIPFALMVALYPEYVMMAKQVTGDATAHFFMALVILASLFYIENRSRMSVFCMSAFAAMATMEKWHSAVACFYIALIIVCNCKDLKKFVIHGIQAFLGYVVCLFIIAPNMLWSIREAVGGIIYMYSYDSGGVTPYRVLLRTYVRQVNLYAGIGFTIVLLCGVIYMLRNFTRKYMILLLGVIKLFALCFLNRGFSRWAQEYFYTILLVAAMGVLLLVENRRRIWNVAGYLLNSLICLCFLTGSVLIVVTAVLGRQDTRLAQDAWCRENGIDTGNSLYGYYTAYNPGGVSVYDNKENHTLNSYLNEERQIDWKSVEEDKAYLIMSSYPNKVNTTWLKDENLPIVKEFSSVGNDIVMQPCIGVTNCRSEFVRIYEFGRQIVKIMNGAYTGPDIVIYDISGTRQYNE